MIKKLKSRAGLTLTELMITLAILTMFSSACLVGIAAAIRTRNENIKVGNADILASMVSGLITEELSLSSNLKSPDGPSIKYTSVEGERGDAEMSLSSNGHLMITYGTNASATPKPMLSEAAYGSVSKNIIGTSSVIELRIDDLQFKITNGADGCKIVNVSFKILDSDSNVIKEDSFLVRPLNDIK